MIVLTGMVSLPKESNTIIFNSISPSWNELILMFLILKTLSVKLPENKTESPIFVELADTENVLIFPD